MSLRFRITLAALVSVLIVSLGQIFFAEMIANNWSERLESTSSKANEVLWNKIIANQHEAMEVEIGAITRDRKLRKLIQKGEAETLREEAAPTFRRLNASNIISKQQLVSLDKQILFSMPDTAKGISDRFTISQAIEQGKAAAGIAIDGDKLVLELAFPILTRGKVIGAGIYIKELDDALTDFKINHESEATIVDASGKVALTSNSELYNGLEISMPELGSSDYLEVAYQGKHYAVTITPINGPRDAAIGHLVDIQDHSGAIASANKISGTSYFATLFILIIVGAFFAWFMRRSFAPIEQAVGTMERISHGDLTVQIEAKSDDEVGTILKGMAEMSDNLRNIMSRLIDMTSKLSQSANELKGSADESNSGVQSQLSEIDQVATAMNEMTATFHDVAQNASNTAHEASSANDDSATVKTVVEQATHSIHALHTDIQASSDAIQKLQHETSEIGGVLEVIKGIAEQTNLLALNAAIEAARAGEQGRGFAVVADEVRTLAGRTQQSTEDINEMIERLQNGANQTVTAMQTSLDQVQTNVETINSTGDSLKTITSAISSINNMNLQIASAAEQQSAVAEEINRNVVNIARVAEESATRVDETRKASDQLTKLTDELSDIVSRFKI